MHVFRTPRLISIACTLAVLACRQAAGPDIGRLPVLTSDDPQAEAEVREANQLLARGQRDAAAEKYRAFLRARPEDPLVPLVQLSLGKILLSQRRDAEALALFSAVSDHREPAVAEQGRFFGAVASQRLGRHNEAIQALAPMVGRTIEPADTLLLLETLHAAYVAEGRAFDAIATLELLQRDAALPRPKRDAARHQIVELVQQASAADIRRAIEELDPKGYAFRHVIARAIRDADAAGDLERTRELLELAQENNVPFDDELSAIALRAAAPSDANPAAVGALLPLSGRARRVGEQALRGLMLAANLPAQGPKPANAPTVVFRDSGVDAERAIQAVNELVSVHRVIAIIGPLDSQIAMVAGARAQELGVPMLALTPGGSPSTVGEMVFRYFPTPQAEATALARAAQARGARSFAVLHPQNAYGETLLAEFRRAAAAVGLREVAAVSYPPGATSFGSEAADLRKQSFDALLVPDSSQQLALIAPALAAAGLWSTSGPPGTSSAREAKAQGRGTRPIRNIVLLAPSVAFDPGLPRLAGRYLQGAMFSVAFDPQSTEPKVSDFVVRFRDAFGTTPDMFAAFAHDAYRLVRRAVDGGALSRDALSERLPQMRDADSVTASPGFAATREAASPTRIVQLNGETFEAP